MLEKLAVIAAGLIVGFAYAKLNTARDKRSDIRARSAIAHLKHLPYFIAFYVGFTLWWLFYDNNTPPLFGLILSAMVAVEVVFLIDGKKLKEAKLGSGNK